jgi:hypothetical protein
MCLCKTNLDRCNFRLCASTPIRLIQFPDTFHSFTQANRRIVGASMALFLLGGLTSLAHGILSFTASSITVNKPDAQGIYFRISDVFTVADLLESM